MTHVSERKVGARLSRRGYEMIHWQILESTRYVRVNPHDIEQLVPIKAHERLGEIVLYIVSSIWKSPTPVTCTSLLSKWESPLKLKLVTVSRSTTLLEKYGTASSKGIALERISLSLVAVGVIPSIESRLKFRIT
jgi:hypothetical protein